MRLNQPGKVTEHLWLLGQKESGIYILEGRDESMIINGGMSYIVPKVLRQMELFHIQKEKIKKLLILHAHFDHVGVMPFFKRTYPYMEIYASTRAWEILGMPRAIKTINAFSKSVTERMDMVEACTAYDLDWRQDIKGHDVSEGDVIALGNMDVHIFETPGHSSCSISAYVPRLKALFPSDGGGIPFQKTIITSGNSNFTAYQQSLEKLKELDVEILCADHYGYVTGDEARRFIASAIQTARAHRKEMEAVYARTRDIQLAAKELSDSFYQENSDYLLTREIFEAVYRQMLRHIAESMDGQQSLRR